jgi:hypothetical protein
MAKLTQKDRLLYQQEIRFYKNKIDNLRKEIGSLKVEAVRNKNSEAIIRFKIANLTLNEISLYCSMNEISVHLLNVKNTAFLEKARQQLYEVIITIENTVTKYLDVPFSEYEEKLEQLSDVSDLDRLNFIKKLGYCIDLVKENLGENTKWKWSFIEIDGRFSVVAKNLFNLKRFQRLDDPRQNGFNERRELYFIIENLLHEASQGYRSKFELITKDVEDLKKGIDFQKALLRICQLSGDEEKINKSKKHIEVWTNLLEKHMAEKDEEQKKKNILGK